MGPGPVDKEEKTNHQKKENIGRIQLSRLSERIDTCSQKQQHIQTCERYLLAKPTNHAVVGEILDILGRDYRYGRFDQHMGAQDGSW